jgi:DNA polymerase-3 subunit beta
MLVEGSFPDYRQVVPRSIQVACRVERVELLEALKRISIISPDKSGGVRFTLEDRRLTLSSQHSGRGKGKQEVRVREGGGNLEVGFNARYFIDALQVIDTADVLLEMTNHLSPCIVRPHCEKNDESNRANFSQINVVMPMRL